MIERPARERRCPKCADKKSAIKNLHPDKSENEGIQRILFRTRGTGWPHPSLDGEVGSFRSHDEHNQTDILTSGLTSLPPSRRRSSERHSGLWEFVARYSGATVPDSHGVP